MSAIVGRGGSRRAMLDVTMCRDDLYQTQLARVSPFTSFTFEPNFGVFIRTLA